MISIRSILLALLAPVVTAVPVGLIFAGRHGGRRRGGGHHDFDAVPTDSVPVETVSNAVSVPELDGGTAFLAIGLTLLVIAIIRERQLAKI